MINAENFRKLPLDKRMKFIDSLTNIEAMQMIHDWEFMARNSQIPDKNWGSKQFIWLILAGRGFGKTRAGGETLIDLIRNKGYKHTTLVGATADDVRQIMIEGESGILKIAPPDFYPIYSPSKKQLLWPNGVITLILYGTEPEKARGKQHDFVWMDELGSWDYPEETYDHIMFGLRLGKFPKAMITTTPKPTKLIKELVKSSESVILTKGTTYDNQDNLAKTFFDNVIKKYEGTRLGRQELNAEVLDDNPSAHWKSKWIDETRLKKVPIDMERVVIGVDPQGTDKKKSHETGICAVGLNENHFYTLEDGSLCGSPNEWAQKAIDLYYKHMADAIVVETNFGGDMVKTVILNLDENVNIIEVRASRGKHIRAEPIAGLTEQKRTHMIGFFSKLEDELTQWDITMGYSPNRLDAYVWAHTELSQGEVNQYISNTNFSL